MDGERTITPGRIITAEELQAQGLTPAIILRNDFGIAAIKSRRAIPHGLREEIAGLDDWALDDLGYAQIHYDPLTQNATFDKGIPPVMGQMAHSALVETVQSTNCRAGRATFFVGQPVIEPLHVDHKLMGHLNLSDEFGMVGYSFQRGTLKLKDQSGHIDIGREELERRVQTGDAERDQLKAGEFLLFNPTFAHESNRDAPVDAKHIRVVMVLTPWTY